MNKIWLQTKWNHNVYRGKLNGDTKQIEGVMKKQALTIVSYIYQSRNEHLEHWEHNCNKIPESYNNPTHEATTRSRKATITLPHERSYLPQNTSVMSVKT